MAAATINKRFITALGPVKMEFINATVTDAETIVSNLQNPEYAIGVNNADADVTTVALNIALTANSRTLTINNAALSDSEVNILVFGF